MQILTCDYVSICFPPPTLNSTHQGTIRNLEPNCQNSSSYSSYTCYKDLLTILFADDTTLQMSNQDAHALFGKVNDALALASDWFKAKKLTLHPSKTMYIFFSAGQHTELIDETLTLDGVAIEQIGLNCETKWLTFLGMRLDDKLSWEGQRAHVYQKAAAGTFMLAHLKRTVPHRIRLMIYNSLVRPYFEYCIEVWGVLKSKRPKGLFQITENVYPSHFGGCLQVPHRSTFCQQQDFENPRIQSSTNY